MFGKVTRKTRAILPQAESFLQRLLALARELGLEHHGACLSLQQLPVIDEDAVEDFEVRGHGSIGALSTHGVCHVVEESGPVVRPNLPLSITNGRVPDRHAGHVSFDFGVLIWPECHIFDLQRVPDVLAHVILQIGSCETFDQQAGPVNAAAIVPASSRLKEERFGETGQYSAAAVDWGFIEVGVIFLMERAHGIVDDARGVSEEMATNEEKQDGMSDTRLERRPEIILARRLR